ncbi:MAG: hypothetical protein P4L33_05045 [Capsulimonadaceae bacterium]|nr:hypothetical protein [Capsulimonadaceae bacterium]
MNDSIVDSPLCVLLAICNDVIEDKTTNNKTLVNLFNGITAQSVPARHPKMCLVASITNIRSKVPVRFSVLGPSGSEVLSANGEANGNNPLEVLDIVVQLLGFPLPEFGEYRIELTSGDKYLMSRKFTVMQAQGMPKL